MQLPSGLSAVGFVLVSIIPLIVAQTTTIGITSTATWEGWGVSLAWWAAAFGDMEDLADIFFSLETTTFNGQVYPGLGLNIARYNAGACSWNTYDGVSMVVSPDMIPTRQMDAYWINWASNASTSDSWDWTVDANQRNMLQLAQDRGANTFELFSNSPVWWMCYNYNPSGSNDGSSDNLQDWNYAQHAYYLATIAKYASENWGVSFTSVEAFNEPSADYWVGLTGTQEGCHFDVTTQAAVLPYLRQELDNYGLTGTLISASDEETYDIAITTFETIGDTALSYINRVNVHGYEYGSGSRNGLYDLAEAAGKPIWNSEYGDSDATGSSLISNLILDFIWLQPTAWVYWQALDVPGWGLIEAENSELTIGAPSQKYFVLAQFTRHIREGMTILSGGSDYTVAAYDASAKQLIIVAVNWGAEGYLTFDLADFSEAGVNGALVQRWSTQLTSGDQYVAYNDTYISGTEFWSYFDTDTVMTFQVDNVVL